jgi:serine/threonine protein kinase
MTGDEPTILDDRYSLDELIGRGGMAEVYRGTDQLLLRPVAVKVLREVAEDAERERFIEEARTLASLNHPNLVTLLDAGILISRPYLVMELASGPTLSACISGGPLDPDRMEGIGRQLAEALAYAHARGVVHRDVKPSNVLVCDGERVLLADFGIARLIGAAQHHTKSGDAIGSPAYLAPEQAACEPLTPAADIYSLGLVLLEGLTGVRAYTGSPIEAAVARLQAGPNIPDDLDFRWRSLVERMTQRDPTRRPTAEEVASALGASPLSLPGAAAPRESQAAIDTGELESTEERAVPSQGDEARPRRRLRVAASVGLVLLLLVIGLVVIRSWNEPATTDPDPVVPSGVPSRLQEPLSDLHKAIEGHHR